MLWSQLPPPLRARLRGRSPAGTLFERLARPCAVMALALLNAIMVVQALNLYHTLALSAPHNAALAALHGRWLFSLEQHVHLDAEPALQRAAEAGLGLLGERIPGTTLRVWAAGLYLAAFPAWLFAGLAWTYLFRRRRFALVRDLTIISSLLSVLCYQLVPVAPPRIVLAGAPYHVQDWVYGQTAIDGHIVALFGMNPWAAFPSVHVLWSLIPAVCLLAGCRHLWVWAATLPIPAAMIATVIVTGNHYLLDCAGSIAVLAISWGLARAIDRLRRWLASSRGADLLPGRPSYALPGALCLCFICAGALANVGHHGIRELIALEIALLVIMATRRSPNLWSGAYSWPREGRPTTRLEYLAGILFVAGAATATKNLGGWSDLLVRIGALLWLLACLCVVVGHVRSQMARRAAASL